MNRDHSVIFKIASKYCISDSFVNYDGNSISSKRFLPTSALNSFIPVHLSLLIPKMSASTLAVSCLSTSSLPWFQEHSRFLCNIALYSIGPYFHHQSHQHLTAVFLWLCLFILSGVISPPISSSILGTYWPGEFLFQCPIFFFAFSYCSWGSQGKNTEVVCHSLL